jgi:hypothetical protein
MEAGRDDLVLGAKYPEKVFLVGQMADHPTNTIHWPKPAAGVFIFDTLQATEKLAARKAQLGH